MNKRLVTMLALLACVGGFWLIRKPRDAGQAAKPVAPRVSDSKAIEILGIAGEACKSVNMVSYDVDYQGFGVFAESVPRIMGSVRFDNSKECARVTITLEQKDGDIQKFDIATNGEQVVNVDHSAKYYTFGPHPGSMMLFRPAMRVMLDEFGEESAFQKEKKGYVISEGVQTVGDSACDVVLASFKNGRALRWYFHQEDHLPRRVERIFNSFSGMEDKDKQVLTLTKLDVGATFEKEDFQIPQPEGFVEREITPPEPPLAVGVSAPDWELKTSDDKTVRLSDLRGQVVVLDFWATWCGPCKIAMPKLQELHIEFADKSVSVLGINCREFGDGDATEYMESKDYTYGLLLDGDDVADAYHAFGLPTMYVIDASGTIVYNVLGAGDEDALRAAVIKALEDSST